MTANRRIIARHTPRADHVGTIAGTYRAFRYTCSCGWETPRTYASTQTAGNAWIRHAEQATSAPTR
jgi:hypothetical protein